MDKDYKKSLEIYDQLIEQFPEIDRKGKANPYTSVNGHMFSFLGKDGILAVRLSDEDKSAYEEKYKTGPVISYNAVMRGYVPIVDEVFYNQELLKSYIEKSYNYISSLKPKPTKKNKK